ncbi:MAG: hypothetical protein FWG75_01685 [Cystobacterineae bacterium]|nr:hypothetical protein [Cystobacterineae bacterium]
MKRYLYFPLFLLSFLLLGCDTQNKCGDSKLAQQPGDYVVEVYIQGEVSSFEGRRIEVNGVQAKRIDCTAGTGEGECAAYSDKPEYGLSFCTEDKETFLHKPLKMVVYEGESVVSETSHERAECQKSSITQDNYFVLMPEGTLKKDASSRNCDRACLGGVAFCAEVQRHMPPL